MHALFDHRANASVPIPHYRQRQPSVYFGEPQKQRLGRSAIKYAYICRNGRGTKRRCAVDPGDGQSVLAKRSGELLHFSKLGAARRAPICPEQDEFEVTTYLVGAQRRCARYQSTGKQ